MPAPIARDTKNDIHVKKGCMIATVVWSEELKAYPLPGHSKRFPNTVSTPTKANQMGSRICREMERGV